MVDYITLLGEKIVWPQAIVGVTHYKQNALYLLDNDDL